MPRITTWSPNAFRVQLFGYASCRGDRRSSKAARSEGLPCEWRFAARPARRPHRQRYRARRSAAEGSSAVSFSRAIFLIGSSQHLAIRRALTIGTGAELVWPLLPHRAPARQTKPSGRRPASKSKPAVEPPAYCKVLNRARSPHRSGWSCEARRSRNDASFGMRVQCPRRTAAASPPQCKRPLAGPFNIRRRLLPP
jgi:hypothetical protein